MRFIDEKKMYLTTLLVLALIHYLGLASVGRQFWIHRKYVENLVKLFEYGRKRIENVNSKVKQRQRKLSKINECYEEDDEDENDVFDETNDLANGSIFKNTRHRSMSLSIRSEKQEFNISDVTEFLRLGIKAIVDDEVTKRFDAEELKTWNLLTRTDKFYHYHSLRLAIIWFAGFLFRYLFLLPIRFTITFVGVLWLIFCTAIVGLLPDGRLKRKAYFRISIMCFRVLSRGFSAVITYHNKENKAKSGGICVANHTSPIDVVLLHCDNSYALVGQTHGGFLGVLQRALGRATHHIWFDRSEMNDRLAVSKRLREHVEDKDKLPILIFPEGTCINNTSVMMFKKGSFEVGGTIYPAAIKYDARFGDPFWNSSKYGYMKYLLMMMTSWAIVCDVWYLPPMTKGEDESAIDFASRVKSEIALRGGLVDLEWDGQLKRQKVKPEWRAKQQLKYSKRINVDNGSDS